MGFDASKAIDDARVLDPEAASLDRRIPDVAGSMIGVNAGVRLTGFSAAQGRRGIANMLASTKSPMKLDSSFLRSAAGIPASGTLLGAFRPGGAYGRMAPALPDDSLRKPVAKPSSLAVVQSQASTALNASTVRSVAESFRNLYSLEGSTRRWQSIYDGALGNAGFKQVSAMQQTLAGQYTDSVIQIKKSLDIQSTNIGTQVVQRFLHAHESQWRATLDAFYSPLFDATRKFAVGYVGLVQRVGELIEGWWPRFEGAFEWLRREMERWPRDPYGELVPVWNVWLYRLAQAAYEGDYVAGARFLNEIEADGSPDNVLMIGELLKPTFDPERPDRRVNWEQMDPVGARRWLRGRLNGLRLSAWKEEQERKNGEQPYEEESQVVQAITSDVPELEFVEFELREDERTLYEQLRGVLPEQQYWFCWYRAQGLKYEEIAARMGVAPGTVKAHAYTLRRNPGFLEVLGR